MVSDLLFGAGKWVVVTNAYVWVIVVRSLGVDMDMGDRGLSRLGGVWVTLTSWLDGILVNVSSRLVGYG